MSPVPDSFAIPSPTLVPSLEVVSNCIGGKNVLSSASTTMGLPALSEFIFVPLRTIYPSSVSSALRTIRLPSASTIWSPSSAELFIPTVVSLTSPAILRLSSNAISSSSPVSRITLTTSSIVVSSTLVVELKSLTVPVCVVSVLAAVKVPDISLRTKLALNCTSGATVYLNP